MRIGILTQPLCTNYGGLVQCYALQTVLQRMVRSIRKTDKNAEIVVVVGYKAEEVKKELEGENVVFVMNPFYEVTNSISSVWFARDYLERENVAIVHGDVVFSDEIILEHLTRPTEYPYVLGDTSYVRPGAYNIVAKDNQVLVRVVYSVYTIAATVLHT